MSEPWPLWGLELRTPRLTLRPDDDAGVAELMAEAGRGIHPPELMPFTMPWTDAEPEQLVRGGFQHHWRVRGASTPDNWTVNFLVRLDGRVIGTQTLGAAEFALLRQVDTGSWLGMRFQGRGLGTEMRAAVLMLAFDHLGARAARSDAFEDNPRSLGVSRRLGYQLDGTTVVSRRGAPAVSVRQVVTAQRFAGHRPDWKLEVNGLAPALPQLGLA